MGLEEDIQRLHKEAVTDPPEKAVNLCIGVYNRYHPNHRPFVVQEFIQLDNKEFRWQLLGEFNRLEEALEIDAKPYGSSTLCSACRTTFEQLKNGEISINDLKNGKFSHLHNH